MTQADGWVLGVGTQGGERELADSTEILGGMTFADAVVVLAESDRLAVERHDPFSRANKAGYPLPKTTLEYLGIQDPKDRAKRIVRWRPVFQRKKSVANMSSNALLSLRTPAG